MQTIEYQIDANNYRFVMISDIYFKWLMHNVIVIINKKGLMKSALLRGQNVLKSGGLSQAMAQAVQTQQGQAQEPQGRAIRARAFLTNTPF